MSRLFAGLRASAVIVVVAGAVVSAAGGWEHWRFSAPIVADHVAAPRFAAVLVPAAVTAHASPGWTDLRVVDDMDREVPHILRVRGGGTVVQWQPARVLDPAVTAEHFSQITVDSGAESRIHNSIRLGVQTDRDFLSWAEIAVSDDARAWRVLRDRAPIYSLTGEGLDRRTQVVFPDSAARYFRVRILDATQAYGIVSAEVARETSIQAEPAADAAAFREEPANDRRTRFVLGPDDSIGPVADVRFTVGQPAFDRSVAIEASDDGQRWRPLAGGEIFRMMEHGVERSALEVGLPDVASRYWRVTVFNRDDAPLENTTVSAAVRPRRVIFEQAPERSYRLLFGNPQAPAPAYEMARVTGEAALDQSAPVTLGPVSAQAAFVPAGPWTERHPVVLWAALALAAAAIGLVAIKTLKA